MNSTDCEFSLINMLTYIMPQIRAFLILGIEKQEHLKTSSHWLSKEYHGKKLGFCNQTGVDVNLGSRVPVCVILGKSICVYLFSHL